ncbi:MAG: hypothetical protein PHD38_03880 [Mesotoga sp.]|uniref:tetratricopeptide repeat protein n=1 Tax=unclassified Mesotoga TaxID=1184398 RepID=UPI00217D450D|nr:MULTISPECIES: hypothetical protein [unclassified Mesotoga]MDI9367386.1 hypothetical protein [Thermotogota bacterium]MDD2333519.1 hypothetical protein [Mesotoga sp.]MDD3681026.1 hypothetical protein [Mesotoga sp.]MDD4206688.1 hypothetical protein [Mesotoga sp.]MDD4826501.1 hypothetical protein [Mesotoga sp.]
MCGFVANEKQKVVGDSLKDKTVLVYLPLKPEIAKANNLPVKLPVLVEDMKYITDRDRIDLDVIIRGLEAQNRIEQNDYYESYLLYYYFEAFKRALNSGNLEEAGQFLEKTARVKKDYRYHFYLGLLLREEEKIELSEIELKKSVEMNEEFYIGHYELGRLLQIQEEYEDAVSSYMKSIEKSGGQFSLPLVATIDCFISKGEYETALEIIERVKKGFPLFADVLLRKGVVLNEIQKYSLAEEAFTDCIGLANDWKSFYNRAYSRARQGKLFAALEDLRTAYDLSRNTEILYEMAIAEKNIGMLEDSLSHCESYYSNTKDEKALVLRARILDMMGEYDTALETLDDTLLELRNSILLHKSMAEGEIACNLSFQDAISESFYSYLMKNYRDSRLTEPSFLESGEINVENLMAFLSDANDENIIRRVSDFFEGMIPRETREITLSEVGLFTEMISHLDFLPSQQDYLSYLMAFIVSGNGRTTAIFRTLVYLLRWALSEFPFRIELFVDEYLEELKDLDFDFALKIAKLIEYGGTDIDTLQEEARTDPEDVTLAIINALDKGTISDLKIQDESLNRYIIRLSGIGGK